MTRIEAIELLEQHAYTPGVSKTKGMPAAKRVAIKAACRVLFTTPEEQPAAAPAPAPER